MYGYKQIDEAFPPLYTTEDHRTSPRVLFAVLPSAIYIRSLQAFATLRFNKGEAGESLRAPLRHCLFPVSSRRHGDAIHLTEVLYYITMA